MTTGAVFQPLAREGVKIVPVLEDDVLHITMLGSVEMRDPGEVLNPYWTNLDAEALKLGIKSVEVNLRSVNFMNSSGILTLVRWVSKLKTRPVGEGYTVLIRFDRNVTWQRTNVPMLGKLAPGAVTASADEPA